MTVMTQDQFLLKTSDVALIIQACQERITLFSGLEKKYAEIYSCYLTVSSYKNDSCSMGQAFNGMKDSTVEIAKHVDLLKNISDQFSSNVNTETMGLILEPMDVHHIFDLCESTRDFYQQQANRYGSIGIQFANHSDASEITSHQFVSEITDCSKFTNISQSLYNQIH
jgi:hypothetical protein